MRKVSREALARLPEPTKHYKDPNGFVFTDCPVSEAEPDWVEMTPEECQAFVPLQETDRRRWEAWHARKGGA